MPQNAVDRHLVDKLGSRVRFNTPLAPFVAYRVGGPADILITPRDEADLELVRKVHHDHQIPVTVIGRGTNLLILDGGIRGITLSLVDAFQDIELRQSNPPLVRCGGGAEKPALLAWAARRGYAGLEFSAGVPGTIGGGIFMNAGTKYGSYGEILRRLRLFDFQSGAREVSKADVHFGYREQTAVRGSLVLWAEFELREGDTSVITGEVERIVAERAHKQPLEYPSCGSTFKNPPTGGAEGLSAGRLVERAHLKGLTRGGAQISEKHANFILNRGGATAADILFLIEAAETRVENVFGVRLEREVIVLGDPQ